MLAEQDPPLSETSAEANVQPLPRVVKPRRAPLGPAAKALDPAEAHGRVSPHASNGLGRPIDPATHDLRSIVPVPDRGDVQSTCESPGNDDIALLIELWRQRQDLRRAERRLDLQCQAICRRASDGDKERAGRLWKAIKNGDAGSGVALILAPYMEALGSLARSAKALEKTLCKEAQSTRLWTAWADDVRGIAALSLAGLLGEAARPLSDYRSVSALWKRFGLAVINGERQRRVKDAELALVHGYSAERRAYAYVLATNLMRSQREGDPYRALYDRRKAYELARDIPKAHAHNRALRVMVKELLKDAWVASRRAA